MDGFSTFRVVGSEVFLHVFVAGSLCDVVIHVSREALL